MSEQNSNLIELTENQRFLKQNFTKLIHDGIKNVIVDSSAEQINSINEHIKNLNNVQLLELKNRLLDNPTEVYNDDSSLKLADFYYIFQKGSEFNVRICEALYKYPLKDVYVDRTVYLVIQQCELNTVTKQQFDKLRKCCNQLCNFDDKMYNSIDEVSSVSVNNIVHAEIQNEFRQKKFRSIYQKIRKEYHQGFVLSLENFLIMTGFSCFTKDSSPTLKTQTILQSFITLSFMYRSYSKYMELKCQLYRHVEKAIANFDNEILNYSKHACSIAVPCQASPIFTDNFLENTNIISRHYSSIDPKKDDDNIWNFVKKSCPKSYVLSLYKLQENQRTYKLFNIKYRVPSHFKSQIDLEQGNLILCKIWINVGQTTLTFVKELVNYLNKNNFKVKKVGRQWMHDIQDETLFFKHIDDFLALRYKKQQEEILTQQVDNITRQAVEGLMEMSHQDLDSHRESNLEIHKEVLQNSPDHYRALNLSVQELRPSTYVNTTHMLSPTTALNMIQPAIQDDVNETHILYNLINENGGKLV